jgi:endonuclease G
MKGVFSILFLLVSLSSTGQDLITIKHTNYTSFFSKSLKYPVLVEWWLTKNKITCSIKIERIDTFKADSQALQITDLEVDYKKSGYDRGHNMPAAENQCQGQKILEECFYFSNITPQIHNLNSGLWKSLEIVERKLSVKHDSVHIWSGAIGKMKEIGINKVAVPTKFWKVLHIKSKNEWLAFIFDNKRNENTSLHQHQVDVEYISEITGFKFN